MGGFDSKLVRLVEINGKMWNRWIVAPQKRWTVSSSDWNKAPEMHGSRRRFMQIVLWININLISFIAKTWRAAEEESFLSPSGNYVHLTGGSNHHSVGIWLNMPCGLNHAYSWCPPPRPEICTLLDVLIRNGSGISNGGQLDLQKGRRKSIVQLDFITIVTVVLRKCTMKSHGITIA